MTGLVTERMAAVWEMSDPVRRSRRCMRACSSPSLSSRTLPCASVATSAPLAPGIQ